MSARRISGSASGQALRGLEQLGQVVEVGCDLGVFRPVGLFSSMASARRISGSASARRFVAWSNWARLLRAGLRRHSGCSGPKLFYDRWRARGISGSASARRFVAWSSVARLLRCGWRQLGGVPSRRLFSSMASRARRISGSASARRLVAWRSCGQVVEVGRDVGVFRPEALLGSMASARRISGSASARAVRGLAAAWPRLLRSDGDTRVVPAASSFVDGQRPPHQRFRLGQTVRRL